MTSMPDAHASARSTVGQARVRVCLGAVVALMLTTLAEARTDGLTPPDQPPSWELAVTLALEDRFAVAVSTALLVDPNDAAREATHAATAHADRARRARDAASRRTAVRRIEGGVFLTSAILVSQSARTGDSQVLRAHANTFVPQLKALVETCGRLDREDRRRCERFSRWSRLALGQYLLNARRFPELDAWLKRTPLPDDDATAQFQALMLRGLAQEAIGRSIVSATFGSSGLQGQLPTAGGGSLTELVDVFSPGRVPNRSGAAREARRKAVALFRRALEIDATHEEARLHLGRTLIDIEAYDEARQELQPLVDVACRTTTCGLALLFTGQAHELQGQLDDASRAYSEASASTRTRQSALLALVGLALRRGRPEAAAALTTQFAVSAPMGSSPLADAWVLHLGGRRLDVEVVLAPLRKELQP